MESKWWATRDNDSGSNAVILWHGEKPFRDGVLPMWIGQDGAIGSLRASAFPDLAPGACIEIEPIEIKPVGGRDGE